MSAKATLVVLFGDDAAAGGFVKAEFDEVQNVNADGEVKTQFFPGDEIFFLVQHEPALRIDKILPTDGMVVPMQDVTRQRSDRFDFAEIDDAQELSYIQAGSVPVTWLGNQAAISRDGRSIIATGGQLPAKGDFAYSALMHGYRLIPPPLTLAVNETYDITIYIYMVTA